MKTTQLWIGPLVGALFFMSGCSSTPYRVSTVEAQNRSEYIRTVDRRLDDWEREAASFTDQEFGREMMASVRDARAEVRGMESAPADEWDSYKRRVENRMDHIRALDERIAE
jgi:hypothetical protein